MWKANNYKLIVWRYACVMKFGAKNQSCEQHAAGSHIMTMSWLMHGTWCCVVSWITAFSLFSLAFRNRFLWLVLVPTNDYYAKRFPLWKQRWGQQAEHDHRTASYFEINHQNRFAQWRCEAATSKIIKSSTPPSPKPFFSGLTRYSTGRIAMASSIW